MAAGRVLASVRALKPWLPSMQLSWPQYVVSSPTANRVCGTTMWKAVESGSTIEYKGLKVREGALIDMPKSRMRRLQRENGVLWTQMEAETLTSLREKAVSDGMVASSTLKKRRLKMNKHKYRKRKKRDRKRTKQ